MQCQMSGIVISLAEDKFILRSVPDKLFEAPTGRCEANRSKRGMLEVQSHESQSGRMPNLLWVLISFDVVGLSCTIWQPA